MSDNEIAGLITLTVGFVFGFLTGHVRGYIAGVRWCTERLDKEPAALKDAE